MSAYIFCSLIGYLIGSLPTAFILVKHQAGLDIRKAGSGNVGAMNTYETTHSRLLGITVFAIDCAKGMIVVLLCSSISPGGFARELGGIFSIIGHNYPVWLRGKGGRGLSTAAGVMILLGTTFVAVWCGIWILSFLLLKRILYANVIALFFSTPIMMLLPHDIAVYHLLPFVAEMSVFLLALIVSLVILLKHHIVFKELYKKISTNDVITHE